MTTFDEDKDLAARLLSASSRHDIATIESLLQLVSVNVQDEETGSTPLHAAISVSVGETGKPAMAHDEDTSRIVEILLANGAIWNDLDKNDETPGCIAFRLGLRKTYRLMVDAGIRAELLLSKLEQLDETGDGNERGMKEQHENEDGAQAENTILTASPVRGAGLTLHDFHQTSTKNEQFPPPDDYIDYWESNDAFLRSTLRYTDTTLLDHSSNAVMMDWETEIMNRHAATLLPLKGLRAMNIGHGMGIVDSAIQTHEPCEHHIVEAHPMVIDQMRKKGWFDKCNVIIHQGRWQDVLPKLASQGVLLDAIYYDTFAEDYKDLKDLFTEHVIGLLEQSGRFGFYNGMGADRQTSYDVYQGVVEIDLEEAGFLTEWEDIPVPALDWKGVRRPYWAVPFYRLPTCKLA